jgi:hypothetical protein
MTSLILRLSKDPFILSLSKPEPGAGQSGAQHPRGGEA